VKRIAWQDLRDIFKLAGWVEARTKGDHLVMTKPGMVRPVVIKMDKDLGEDLVRSNMRTAGMDRAEFEKHLNVVRRHKKRH
jgi:predicted RNA binding protein YcfA (HicA-like mRNA interferase family)